MKINKIYEECGFNNPIVLLVTETLLTFLKTPSIKKSDDNEIVISVKKGKLITIFIIDNCADIQRIKTKNDELESYDVFYYSDVLDFDEIVS